MFVFLQPSLVCPHVPDFKKKKKKKTTLPNSHAVMQSDQPLIEKDLSKKDRKEKKNKKKGHRGSKGKGKGKKKGSRRKKHEEEVKEDLEVGFLQLVTSSSAFQSEESLRPAKPTELPAVQQDQWSVLPTEIYDRTTFQTLSVVPTEMPESMVTEEVDTCR